MLIPFEGIDNSNEINNLDNNFTSILVSKLYGYCLEKSLISILLFITIIFLTKGIISFIALGYNSILKGRFLKILKEKIYTKLSSINYKYYLKKDTGNFINVINEQVYRAIQSFHQLTATILQLTNCLFYLGFAILVAWGFGIMAVIFGLLILIFFKFISIHVLNNSRMLASENGYLSNLLVQSIQGFKYLLATNQNKNISRNIFHSIDKLSLFQIKTGVSNAFTASTRDPLAVFFISI